MCVTLFMCQVCFFVPYDELKANMIAGYYRSISTLYACICNLLYSEGTEKF